jgi:hypothetical protein
LNYHNNIWKVIKMVYFLVLSFPHPSFTACNLDSNYFPNTLSSSILRLFYSFEVRDQISRPYKTNIIWAKYILIFTFLYIAREDKIFWIVW